MLVAGVDLVNFTAGVAYSTISAIPRDVATSRSWLSWIFGGAVKYLKVVTTWSVLCLVPGTLYLDLVCWIMKIVRRRHPGDDLRWWSQAFTVWLLLLYPQAGFWYHLLASPPLAVCTARLQLFFAAHAMLVRFFFSDARRRELVGDQVLLYLTQPYEEDMHLKSAWRELVFWFCVDMAVIYKEWHDLVDYVPYSLHGAPCLPVLLIAWQSWVYGRNFSKLFSGQGMNPTPWTISSRPFCQLASPDVDCQIHDTCRICLDNLCWRGATVTTPLIDEAPEYALSVCRARHRPRSASPGISACRKAPTSSEMPELQTPAAVGQLATLRCGHTFHVECISAWRKKGGLSASCPACRASLIESTIDGKDVRLFFTGGFMMLLILLGQLRS
mmetsp:Transcript_50115/g.92492  ORF Transcript_50115/g.92492 Transcript_50115/m.92492 type:complete len:385 (+) Transcript_50115:57-1211(+)